jgi:glycosyltransferase involved in cell wall biosynthesis
LAVAIAAVGLRRRVCWVVHEVVPRGPYGLLWALAARRAECIYTYSRAAGLQPALAKARVSVLPVHLELERFFDVEPVSGAPRVLGLVGDLFPLKNHLALVEVVRRLRAAGEAVEGRLIARDFSYGARDAEYVRAVKAAVGGPISLTSAEPSEMPAKLAEIDLLLHLTKAPESFGRVCVEAMAAGRPVIGFDHGAVSELVESGRTGILCPLNDLSCVERAIRVLRRDRDRFAGLSRTAREVAYERWGPGQEEPSIGEALAAFAQKGSSIQTASEA